MTKLSRSLIFMCLSLALFGAPPAFGAPPTAEDLQAKAAFEEGTKYYNLGDFPKAIASFTKGYEIKPEPVFLYNIAQAHRLKGDFTQALFFYKSYLRNRPNASNKVEVEKRIAEMDEALKKQHEAQVRPPDSPINPNSNPTSDPKTPVAPEVKPAGDPKIPSPDQATLPDSAGATAETGGSDEVPTNKPIYKKWWFWTGIGAVAVGTIVLVAASGGGGNSPPDSDFGVTTF